MTTKEELYEATIQSLQNCGVDMWDHDSQFVVFNPARVCQGVFAIGSAPAAIVDTGETVAVTPVTLTCTIVLDLDTTYFATTEGLSNLAVFLRETFSCPQLTIITRIANLVSIYLRPDLPIKVHSSRKIFPDVFQVVLNLH